MKTKVIVTLAMIGIVLSFGATKSIKKQSKVVVQSSIVVTPVNEPIGGFISEDH